MGSGQRAHPARGSWRNSEVCPACPFIANPPPYIRRVRRHWISRSLASVLALWLAVCLAEPVQLHTCAMHGGLAIDVGSVATHSHTATAEHLGHTHHGQDTDNQSRQCSCLGDCSAGRPPIGIAAANVALPTVAIIQRSAADFTYDSPRVVAPRFLLPFSNGPPAGSSRA
jgi:predicted lipoprotein with Yx(FWY)xxD motif